MKIGTTYLCFCLFLLALELSTSLPQLMQYSDIHIQSSIAEELEIKFNPFYRDYNYGTCTCSSSNWINPFNLKITSNSLSSSVGAVNGLLTYFSINYYDGTGSTKCSQQCVSLSSTCGATCVYVTSVFATYYTTYTFVYTYTDVGANNKYTGYSTTSFNALASTEGQSFSAYTIGCDALATACDSTTTATSVTSTITQLATTTASCTQTAIYPLGIAAAGVAAAAIAVAGVVGVQRARAIRNFENIGQVIMPMPPSFNQLLTTMTPSTLNRNDDVGCFAAPIPINENWAEKTKETNDFPSDGCGNTFTRFAVDGRCYPLLQRGPCADSRHWITLNPIDLKGYCTKRLCGKGRVFVGSDGLCHDARFPPAGECQGGRRLYYTAYGDPICDCPFGQSVDPSTKNRCQQQRKSHSSISVSFWHKPKEHQNSIGWRHNEETDSSSLLVPCHFDTRTARNGNNFKCASNRQETNDKYKVIKKRQQTAEATVIKFVCPLDHILDAKGQCRPVSCYAIAAANCGPSYHLIYDAKNDRENWCRQREFIFIKNHQ